MSLPDPTPRARGTAPASFVSATQIRPIPNVSDIPTPPVPADDGAHGTYLSRIRRELKADVRTRDVERIEPIASIPCGRSEVELEVVTSERHGVSVRLTCWAPQRGNGAARLRQVVWMYIEELAPLIEALETAKARLVAAPRAKRSERGQP